MDSLNLVKNPRLAPGRRGPRSWRWCGDGGPARWTHEPSLNGRSDPVLRLECPGREQSAHWSQTLRCRGKQAYRLEADVECDCAGSGEDSGLALSVRFLGDTKTEDRSLRFPPVRGASGRNTLRGYFTSPPDARTMEICVGIAGASGWARIHDVRLYTTLQPDTCAHPLAVPPPAYAQVAPRRVRRAVVYGDAAATPSLLDLLRARFGPSGVDVHPPATRGFARIGGDAVLIPSERPPSGLRTPAQLERFARDRVVVISLRAFGRLGGAPGEFRVVEQGDDPIHATVRYACFVTAGFALHDVVPFAAAGEDPTVFVQRQFVTNLTFRSFCKRFGFEVLLTAVTDNDRTMDKPIALFKRTPQGAVIVCDLDPLEAPPTTLGEHNTVAALVLNTLGAPGPVLGQFIVPARAEQGFRQELVDLRERFPALSGRGIHDPDVALTDTVIELGHDEPSFGLPASARPAVVIRTGLRQGDEDGIYGTMLWIKHLLRPMPHPCPYVRYFSRRFRLRWLPLGRPWNDSVGMFRSDGRNGADQCAFDAGPTRLVVDVTCGATAELRVVVGRRGRLSNRLSAALPMLFAASGDERHIALAPIASGDAPGGAARGWRPIRTAPCVTVDESVFVDRAHHSALRSGADLVRIELPPSPPGLMGDSIQRTELAARTLEHVIGVACDGFAVNRTAETVDLDPTVLFGESCRGCYVVRVDAATGEDGVEQRLVGPVAALPLAPGTAIVR